MAIDVQNLEVVNNRGAHRFEVKLGDKLGVIDYKKNGPVYVFTHTGVPSEFSGQGIANRLVQVALDTARDEGNQVVPQCPFVKTYIQRHPQYQSLVVATAEE